MNVWYKFKYLGREKSALAHSFGRFSTWLVGPLTFGPRSMQYVMTGAHGRESPLTSGLSAKIFKKKRKGLGFHLQWHSPSGLKHSTRPYLLNFYHHTTNSTMLVTKPWSPRPSRDISDPNFIKYLKKRTMQYTTLMGWRRESGHT
jgi:hypothetical protein